MFWMSCQIFSALRGLLVLPVPFGALAAWLDRMLMHTAVALTIRPLPTLLAGVLEGRAAGCRGDAHLGRRETRPQAALIGAQV
jgi:hypothetical protein